MRWDRCIFIDTCLPFFLRPAPKLFNALADLLSWILEQQQAKPVLHHLDDFLIMGPPQSPVCSRNLLVIKDVCSMLGIPLALEKVEGPSVSLAFLGITLDTQIMQAHLPDDKLLCIHHQTSVWLSRKRPPKGRFCRWLAFYNMPPR